MVVSASLRFTLLLCDSQAASSGPPHVAQQLHDACVSCYWQLEDCLRTQLGEKQQLIEQLVQQHNQQRQHRDTLTLRNQQLEQQVAQLQLEAANVAPQRENA